jgi:hypothetical protein
MIYIIGGLHGEIGKDKLTIKYFSVQRELTKNDYIMLEK